MALTLRRELLPFIVVGSSAAAVHFASVIALVSFAGLAPLIANVLAFVLAFQVSYAGHRFWTFHDTTLAHRDSLPRYALVATSSFAINEGLYFLLLHYTTLPYWLSLGLVLVLVAALTFVSSRLWAFARH